MSDKDRGDPRMEPSNGDTMIPEGLSASQYARMAAASALATQYAIGSLTREVSETRAAVHAEKLEFEAFRDETRKNFEALGVMSKRIRKVEKKAGEIEKKAGEIEKKAVEIEEELEDTKTHNLRVLAGKYRWWKRVTLSGIGVVLTGLIVLILGHYLFHIG
jgi:chromosome segregation ATPase